MMSSPSGSTSGTPAGSTDTTGDTPYIPPQVVLPEITIRALVLGVVLAVLLAGANAYLGLFAGMTVSASIPAAVISMAILRLFRNSNILENNIVQTAASAGESVAAGAIFTLPALIMMGYWTDFSWGWTTAVCGIGGLIGVLFSIPLRRALIVRERLRFPEGVATAAVLRTGERGGATGIQSLAVGGLAGALIKLGGETSLWRVTWEGATRVGGSIAYFGSNLSPALLSVGYIVGLNVAVLVFLGGMLNWLVAVPIYAAGHPWPQGEAGAVSALEWAGTIWSTQTRYIGVGAMVIGGLWSLFQIRGALVDTVRLSVAAARNPAGAGSVPRTERDTPAKWIMGLGVAAAIPLFALYYLTTSSVGVAVPVTMVMLIAGFLFSAVAAYMAGLVGSSNNPVSGMTIATILLASALLVLLMGSGSAAGPAAAILVGGAVCCAAAIGGDNMQDLKAGHILGSTPWKQQIMQGVGALSGAMVMAPILMLLLRSNGFGEPTPEHPDPLLAPQATLMASVAQGVFHGGLSWDMVGIGVLLGGLIILIDEFQRMRGASFRVPILAVAVGVYLPLELSVPIFVGGLIAWVAARQRARLSAGAAETAARNGLLFASGLITGEALVGIVVAIPVVIARDPGVLLLRDTPIGAWPCAVLVALVAVVLARKARGRANPEGA